MDLPPWFCGPTATLVDPCTGARGRQTFYWTFVAAALPGHSPTRVLTAQVCNGGSRQIGPSRQSSDWRPNGVKGTGCAKSRGRVSPASRRCTPYENLSDAVMLTVFAAHH